MTYREVPLSGEEVEAEVLSVVESPPIQSGSPWIHADILGRLTRQKHIHCGASDLEKALTSLIQKGRIKLTIRGDGPGGTVGFLPIKTQEVSGEG